MIERLTIIGTSHISKESVREIRNTITEKQPKIVCVELDKRRLLSLQSKESRKPSLRDIRQIGFTGFLFTLIGGWAQQKLGKMVGVIPGEDMLSAVRVAKEQECQVALVDQDVLVTLHRLNRGITFSEKMRFIADIIKAVLFKKREMKKLGIEHLDLSRVPPKELVKKLIARLRERYPNVHRVLVQERNEVMARNIAAILKAVPEGNVIVVVGAGHAEELRKLVEDKYNKLFI